MFYLFDADDSEIKWRRCNLLFNAFPSKCVFNDDDDYLEVSHHKVDRPDELEYEVRASTKSALKFVASTPLTP